MAYNNGWYDNWQSDECSDENLKGHCDGTVPMDDPDAPGAECTCACHGEDFTDYAEVEAWHGDKHMTEQAAWMNRYLYTEG